MANLINKPLTIGTNGNGTTYHIGLINFINQNTPPALEFIGNVALGVSAVALALQVSDPSLANVAWLAQTIHIAKDAGIAVKALTKVVGQTQTPSSDTSGH